jgi:hypothetical protein
MSISVDEVYVCDFCGDDTGRFNSESGNHVACEQLSALQSALTAANEQLNDEIKAHERIANICNNVGAKDIDGTSIGYVQSLAEMFIEKRELLTTAQEALKFNPLAEKLSLKKKPFIVVAIDEPYFKEVYDIIRKEERRKDTWNFDDEMAYVEAIKANRSALNGGKNG